MKKKVSHLLRRYCVLPGNVEFPKRSLKSAFLQTYIMPHSNGYRGRYEPKMDWKIVFSILLCFALISGCLSSQEAAKGTLRLTSSPSGAEIYLDNQFRGSTPVDISSVEQGNHTLEFRYPGYQSWAADYFCGSRNLQLFCCFNPSSRYSGIRKKHISDNGSPDESYRSGCKTNLYSGRIDGIFRNGYRF